MVGALIFLPVFLIKLTSAQCPTPCNMCKEFNAGEMCGPPEDEFDCGGRWILQTPIPHPNCTQKINGQKVNVCMYKREEDNKEYCFCDPGNSKYEECPPPWWPECINPPPFPINSPCILRNESKINGTCCRRYPSPVTPWPWEDGICYPDGRSCSQVTIPPVWPECINPPPNPNNSPCILRDESEINGTCCRRDPSSVTTGPFEDGICYTDGRSCSQVTTIPPDVKCNNYGRMPCELDGNRVGPDGWYCCPQHGSPNDGLCVENKIECIG